jgi:lipopolysaccharide transport system permease protein
VLLIPVILLPLTMFSLGVSWILASLGVYLRDIGQGIGFVTVVLLFISPVFYQIENVPPYLSVFISLNPISLPVENLRSVVLWNGDVQWGGWALSLVLSLLLMSVGYMLFERIRKGFSDVL